MTTNLTQKRNAQSITTMKAVIVKVQCQDMILIIMEATQLLLIINVISMESPSRSQT